MNVFINEGNPGRVENIKLMWNYWAKDAGYGVPADVDLAKAWAATATGLTGDDVHPDATEHLCAALAVIDVGQNRPLPVIHDSRLMGSEIFASHHIN